MIDYLIKSGLCLVILFAVYHFFLEKEKMHRFNRFFLLFSLVFSLLVPFITLGHTAGALQPVEFSPVETITPAVLMPEAIPADQAVITTAPDYQSMIYMIYALATGLLLSRFILNILKVVSRILRNPRIRSEDAEIVLLKETVAPHSFLKYVFLNKDSYLKKDIDEQIVIHEFTHVRQKHSIDVLIAELLKIIFWFNPVFILYKKAIQLNHEFLADESVMTSCPDIPKYQILLLQAAGLPAISIASNFNYSLTKKRLKMMEKHTSRSRIMLMGSALVPLMTILVFLFSSQTKADQLTVLATETVDPGNILKAGSDNSMAVLRPSPEPAGAVMNKAQSDAPVSSTAVQVQPAFPGGANAWAKFLRNYNYPPRAAENHVSGTIFVQFVVEKDGSLTNISVQRNGLGFGTAEEAVRLMKTSPKWKAGIQNGRPVRVSYTQQIKISDVSIAKNDDPVPMALVQVQPMFPGGDGGWSRFVRKYNYPPGASDNNVSGTLYVQFIVEKDGSLTGIKVKRDGLGFGTAEEAIRLMKTSPKWKPGTQNGRKVRVAFMQPIKLAIN